MPTPLSSDSYEFVQYLGNYTNVTQDELVTIKYKSKDDLTRIGIICNADTGYAPTLYFTKTDTSLMTVDFGNGDVLTSSASGDVSFTTTTGYSGYDDFTPFEITVDCEGGSGSYYFTYLMNNTDADSAIEDIVQYIYMSDYIDTMPGDCLKYSNAKNIIVSNNNELDAIGNYALQYANALTSFSAPLATSIGYAVLNDARVLTSFSAPLATSIGNNVLQYANALTSFSAPVATSIGNAVLYDASALTSFSAPLATSIGNYALQNVRVLTSFSAPVATSIGDYVLQNVRVLTSFSAPLATSIGNNVLQYANALTSFSAPVATSIGNYALQNARALRFIKFYTTTPPTISDANFAVNAPYNLKVEVPAGYLATYQSTTNLTHLANRMVGVDA